MQKNKSFFYSLLFSGFLMLLSLPLQAWDLCEPLGLTAEARVAYYSPSSHKVRRIYGDGWADYQIELSKGFKGFDGLFSNFGGCGDCGECGSFGGGLGDYTSFLNEMEVKAFVGVSGFSRRGNSIGFGDRTKIEMLPITFGLKFFVPIACNTKIFIGGAACYTLLSIHDHSDYVHRHTSKEDWGGLVQSGITYDFAEWGYVSVFADYLFQEFHFHKHGNSYGYNYFYDDNNVERHKLDMSGYKVGVGLGVMF